MWLTAHDQQAAGQRAIPGPLLIARRVDDEYQLTSSFVSSRVANSDVGVACRQLMVSP